MTKTEQIEQMKCCANCKHCKYDDESTCYFCEQDDCQLSDWELVGVVCREWEFLELEVPREEPNMMWEKRK